MISFLWRYFRRYTAWAILAALAVLVFAGSSAALVVLIEPIFGEVLMAGEGSAPSLGVLGGGRPKAGDEAGDGAQADRLPPALRKLLRRIDLEHQLKSSYQSLKRRWGIGPDEVVYFVPLLFVVFVMLRSVANFASGYAFQHIGLGSTNEMRNDLYSRILEQSARFHAGHSSGELVARVVSDVAVMQSAVTNQLLDLVQQSVTLVALLVLLLSTQLRLGLLSLLLAPLVLYPIVRFGRGLRRTSHRSQERMADLTSLLSEGVRGYRVVKAFGTERFEQRRFRVASGRHLRVNLRAQLIIYASSPVIQTLTALGMAAFFIYAGRAIRAGELTAPVLVAFLANLLLLYEPVRKLNRVNLVLQQAAAAAERVRSMLDMEVDEPERAGARPLENMVHGITFYGVSFAYDHEPVLKDIDLTIRCGEMVALVGPSGAGKSTLVNLLPRFFDPDQGSVMIDGRDIRDLPLANLRSLVGIVSQETILFDDTVRNNIAYGQPERPLDQVREAAAAAYADEFIQQLPDGYDTRLGEAGLRLSGGQRQRIAIARALLRDAPILILDEATSQLDSESEALVQKALGNLTQGRTTLVIAHRLSTVTKADRIVVMEGGRIVECGSHAELLRDGGTYRRLYDLQFRG